MKKIILITLLGLGANLSATQGLLPARIEEGISFHTLMYDDGDHTVDVSAVEKLSASYGEFCAQRQDGQAQRLIVMGDCYKGALINCLLGNLKVKDDTFERIDTRRGVNLDVGTETVEKPLVIKLDSGALNGTYAIEMPRLEVLDSQAGIIRDVFMHLVTQAVNVKICVLVTNSGRGASILRLSKRLVEMFPYPRAAQTHPLAKSVLFIGVGRGCILSTLYDCKTRAPASVGAGNITALRFFKDCVAGDRGICRFNAPRKQSLASDRVAITEHILGMTSIDTFSFASSVYLRLDSGRIIANIIRTHPYHLCGWVLYCKLYWSTCDSC